MARINLLPWREWERERRKKQFLVNLAACVLVAGGCVFGTGMWLDASVTTQKQRNARFEREIKVLNEKIANIAQLRREREELLARMRVIQRLQGDRPVIVRVFDEVVRTLAKGVHFNELRMASSELSVAGVAESNNRISALMRSLDGSDWFANPNLKGIKEDPGNSTYGAQASTFELTFQQVSPKAEGEDS